MFRALSFEGVERDRREHELLKRIPGAAVDAGCRVLRHGGVVRLEREHYDLSMQIGGMRLFPGVNAAPDAIVSATGVSCRQQIAQGTSRRAVHPVVLLRSVTVTENQGTATENQGDAEHAEYAESRRKQLRL